MAAERVVLPLSRREFCALAAGCAAAAFLVGCAPADDNALTTGAIPDDQGGGDVDASAVIDQVDAMRDEADAAEGHEVDAGVRPDAHAAADAGEGPLPPDAAPSGPVCSASVHDVGAPSTFTSGTAVFFSSLKLFVVRDGGGLYALTSVCTHQGATIIQRSSTQFYCPRHGATFDMNGNATGGPTKVALVHYSLCLLSTGHVAVDTTLRVTAGTRLAA